MCGNPTPARPHTLSSFPLNRIPALAQPAATDSLHPGSACDLTLSPPFDTIDYSPRVTLETT